MYTCDVNEDDVVLCCDILSQPSGAGDEDKDTGTSTTSTAIAQRQAERKYNRHHVVTRSMKVPKSEQGERGS